MNGFSRALVLGLVGCAAAAQAATPPEVVLSDLDTPWGVAVQPETGHVFVAESGRGRILRVVDGRPEDVVVGFPQERMTAEPGWNLGPLSCVFLSTDVMLVGVGGHPEGEDGLYLVEVPPTGQAPVAAANLVPLGKLPATEAEPAWSNFFGLTVSHDAIFTSAVAASGTGGFAELGIKKPDQLNRAEGYGKFKQFAVPALAVIRPFGLTASPRGELVVGDAGIFSAQADSVVSFIRSTDGTRLLHLPTDLLDVVALRYSRALIPQGQPQLYALDLAWAEPSRGGLLRLDATLVDGRPAVASVRLADLMRPTGMAFDSDGQLYVTLIGTTQPGGPTATGQLLRFDSGF